MEFCEKSDTSISLQVLVPFLICQCTICLVCYWVMLVNHLKWPTTKVWHALLIMIASYIWCLFVRLVIYTVCNDNLAYCGSQMYALETKLNEIYLLGVEKWCSYGTSRSPCPCKQGGGVVDKIICLIFKCSKLWVNL